MDFMVFDISQDPLEQGFELGSYDLIIAANVVHATSSLNQTLQHLQLLLAPGGRLLLTEFCTSFRAPNYIYGNFSGWWLGEADNREWEPYVDVARWDKELKSVGLSGTTDVVLDAAEPWHYCATIVSQKPNVTSSSAKEISVLCQDPSAALIQRLIDGLQKEGYRPRTVTFGPELTVDGDIIVSFDLETRFFQDISKENLRYFQQLCRQLQKQNVLWLMPPFQIGCIDPRGSQSLGMIRTARSELDLSITTLEIDTSSTNFFDHVLEVFREARNETVNGTLLPDREYVVHDNTVKIGRYRPFEPQKFTQKQPLNFDPNATYLLTGGLGGLGRTISVWLVENGVSHLIFLSPSAGKKPQDQELFVELESMGCEVIAVQGVAQSEADVSRAIGAATSPIKGVLHLSMQLRDDSVLGMTHANWETVVAPKVDGAWNLHRNLPNDLDFFIMTSSLGTVFQQPGQSNYNAANTFLESFCQYRHSLGLSASVLNICPIEDVGYVAENSDARQKLRSQGHWFLDENALLKFLELCIHQSKPSPSVQGEAHDARSWVNNSQIIMGLRSEIPLDDSSNHTTWRYDRRMGLYHNIVGEERSQNSTEREGLRAFVARASDLPSLLNDPSSKEYLASEIGKKIFSFTMKEEEDMDVSLTLAQVRLDSLMAIELRRWWKQVFGVDVSVLEILNSGTIAGLGEVAVKSLQKRFDDTER